MRFVKVLLFAVLVAGWWQLWHARDAVFSAYVDERPPLALELAGVGATVAERERPISPFALQSAGIERAPTFLSLTPSIEPEDDSTIAVTGGDASLSGAVRLPDGTPVAGATVRIERFTSAGSGTAETISGADGTWTASGLQGGRLRVRAYAPNQLASVDPAVLVVTRSGSATLDLGVVAARPGLRFDMFGPPGIAIGTAGTVAVVVSSEVVDERGRLIQRPEVGRELTASISGGRLLSADVVVSDAGGAVRYLIACDAENPLTANVNVGETDAIVALPLCMSAESLAELEAAAAAERAAEQDANRIGAVR